jgi:hypothetical protein
MMSALPTYEILLTEGGIDQLWRLDPRDHASPIKPEGQIMGGIAQGLGQVLMEDKIYDGRAGRCWPARSWITPCRAPMISATS